MKLRRQCVWTFGLIISFGSLWSAQAGAAADYYVESVSTSDRAVAEARLETLPALGEGVQARVIRRFRVGEGWAFVIRIDALEQEQAQDLASLLGEGDEDGIVYRRIGSRTVRVFETVDSSQEEILDEPAVVPMERPNEDALVAAIDGEGGEEASPAEEEDCSACGAAVPKRRAVIFPLVAPAAPPLFLRRLRRRPKSFFI